jgi:hypothetical protein
MSEQNPFQTLLTLSNGYWASRCLHVVAELGVADRIADEPRAPEDLAAEVGAHAQSLARVLRAVASFGVFEEVDGRYRHSPASRLLRSDHPQSQRPLVRMMGMPVHWAAYGELEYAVRTGDAAMSRIAPGGTFEFFASHPHESRLFDEAMTAKSQQQIPAVLAAYDFSGFERIADIGGGRGHLLQSVLAANPQARGVLCDLPHVLSTVADTASGRLTLQPLDFFKDPLPSCDAYLLSNVIHDWGDDDATAILSSVRRAAPASAKVLLVELMIPETPGTHLAKLLDIEMLVMTQGGRERTRAEFEWLYSAAGFRLERVVTTSTQMVVIQGAVV